MIKYTDTQVTFAEIPTEINLCFSISNCSGMCKNCHSPELRQNIGRSLYENIVQEINNRPMITCVCFLGEGRKINNVNDFWKQIIALVRDKFPHIKIALYSGRATVEQELLELLDYVKVGAYVESLGGLKSPITNQRLYKKENEEWKDITYMFWTSDKNK